MPIFHFDTSGGGKEPFIDHAGLEFSTLENANAHAMTLLPVMGVELPLTQGEFRTWTVTIRDKAGDRVGRFIMAIINDSLDKGPVKALRAMD